MFLYERGYNMSLGKKITLIIIWILVAAGCVAVLKLTKNAQDLQKTGKKVTGNVAAITYSYLYETEEEKKDSRGAIIRTYEYEFKQSIRVTYVVDGKEYSSEFQNLETYSKYSEVSLTPEEQSEIKNTKGYKVGDSIELYVDADNPSDCRLKKSVDHMASGSRRKVVLGTVVFMGVVLSLCVLTTPSKKRYY